jgi:hypothetical protein
MTESDVFRMEGTLNRFLLVYSGAFIIGVVLTYIYVRMLIGTGYLILTILAVPLFAYVFGDLFVWMKRGVRSVEVDSSGLTIHRMNTQSPSRVEADEVTGVYVSKFLDRTTVNIVLRGGTVKRFMGIKRYSGPRIRMTNEPYDRAQFLDFVRRVTTLRRVVQAPQ